MINESNKKIVLKAAKKHFADGNLITVIYDKMMPTGEVATTHKGLKSFKWDVARIIKENVHCHIRIEPIKWEIIREIDSTIKRLRKDGNELVGEDNLWSGYADTLNALLIKLVNHL